jgi:hypothetical protein
MGIGDPLEDEFVTSLFLARGTRGRSYCVRELFVLTMMPSLLASKVGITRIGFRQSPNQGLSVGSVFQFSADMLVGLCPKGPGQVALELFMATLP